MKSCVDDHRRIWVLLLVAFKFRALKSKTQVSAP
jgi:hypothetical protein